LSGSARLGKYELIRKLASGGMAEVFLARAAGPMGFEKSCVLKRILPHLAEDDVFVQMFLDEARLAAQLNHPNVVQIFDFGESDGAYFLAMEFIDGPNLRALYRRAAQLGRPLPIAVCAKIISFAAEGLAYAHDFTDPMTGEPMGLIHRDISPDNVLVSRDGAVKVVDFGIAKAANQTHHTRTGALKGKLAYMPPEQLKARVLDRRVDVFSLGMVFYELLTGMRPFDATSEVEIMQAILNEPPVPAAHRRPDVPLQLQEILDRALAKDREQRYPDCRSFQHDLERFIHSAGEPVGAFQISSLVKEYGALAPTSSRTSLPAAVLPAAQPAQVAPIPPAASEVVNLDSLVGPPPTEVWSAPVAEFPGPAALNAPTVLMPPAAPSQSTSVATVTMPRRHSSAQHLAPVSPPSRLPWVLGAVAVAAVLGLGGYVALSPSQPHIKPLPPEALALQEPAAAAPVAAAPVVPPPRAAEPEPVPEVPEAPPASPPTPPPSPVVVAAPPAAPSRPARAQRIEAAVAPVPRAPSPSPAVAVAAPQPSLASFRIESAPVGQVKVNGRFVGVSPIQVSGLKPGPVEVEVYDSRLGLKKVERFTATAGDNGTRKIVAAAATVEFRVRPWATVFLNGRPLGQTPLPAAEVFEGTHTVRLVNAELGKDITLDFTARPGPNVFRHNLGE
jgi:eukaryotic-like serine/threonine-protein kinase